MVIILLMVCRYDCSLHTAIGTPYKAEASSEFHHVSSCVWDVMFDASVYAAISLMQDTECNIVMCEVLLCLQVCRNSHRLQAGGHVKHVRGIHSCWCRLCSYPRPYVQQASCPLGSTPDRCQM